MHIYLALAIDKFPSCGLKQKSFSPEWKKIYLLWILRQDAIELVSTTGYFHAYRFCPYCSVPGSLSAPQKPQSLYCLHPQSHCKGNPSIEAGLSSAPLPFSGTPTASKPSALLYPGLQRHLDTLLHPSHAWWATGHKRMEMRMILAGWLCIGAALLTWAGQAHSCIPCSCPAEVGTISLVLWMCKSTACSHHVEAGKQQTKNIEGCAFSLDAKYSPWGMDFGTWSSDMLVALSPARSQSSSKNGVERGETTFAHTCVLQPDCPAPGDICHKHMPEHPNLTPSLLARQHRTFVSSLMRPLDSSFSPVLPNTFCLLCPPPASQAQWFWFRQVPLLWEKQTLRLSVCAVERQWAGQEDRELARRPSREWGRVLRWFLVCTLCTWVVVVLASAFSRQEGIEEAKMMLMLLKRP